MLVPRCDNFVSFGSEYLERRAGIRVRPAWQLSGALRRFGNMVLLDPGYHTQNNFLENYPPILPRALKRVRQPGLGRKSLKNIRLNGRLKPARGVSIARAGPGGTY